MSITIYYIICVVLSLLVLLGISMMSKVKTSVQGNLLSAVSLFTGIIITLIHYQIFSISTIYIFTAIGLLIGYLIAIKVKMIQMPQIVAVFNGVGGAASALVGMLALVGVGVSATEYPIFSNVTAALAMVVGMITLTGSLIAAGKLHKILPQKPIIWKNHNFINILSLIISFIAIILSAFIAQSDNLLFNPSFILILGLVFSIVFGLSFSIRVGGADMPITISLLNSLSGVAGSIAGMAIGDILLVAVGGIVGASGLLLTQIMCRAMNRKLLEILLGKTSVALPKSKTPTQSLPSKETEKSKETTSIEDLLNSAKNVLIVPGYGMALAQAQHQVRMLADKFEANGAEVRYAIHPVAGRMPGHMNVLLAEADISYEKLFEMKNINDDFKTADLTIVIGANDVMNPAAKEAEGTPIYGMPILNVSECKNVIICNYDKQPGYAGVENPLYNKDGVILMLGDAKETLTKLINQVGQTVSGQAPDSSQNNVNNLLNSAKNVLIVPGYGMALAQAQHQVRMLADKFEANGAEVRYAIHPVAGRMPGHMNVLLAEADISYEKLFEMKNINDDFKTADLTIVIGANDVMNPAAKEAEGTPIYGMPILNVSECKNVIICNYDKQPGYAGVENPLYNKDGVILMLGDAKETLTTLINEIA